MHAPPGASVRQRLAAFAWLVRNQVRPSGGLAMGWPCQLMGSGMGFLFAQLQHAPVATGNIVEDMQLGMDFASEGRAPLFVPGATVHSEFPSGEQAGQQQRTRWEHGHLATITSAWRQWGVQALRGKTPGLLPMLLDLSVPPMALMVMAQLGAWTVAVVGASAGLQAGTIWFAIALLTLGLMLTTVAVVLAWRGYARHLLSPRELLTVPAYALRKIPLYLGYLVKKQTAWVRTERDAKVGKP
jgi:cellulose synthase/poly-beta-1,6-N-acetylglucosamine synthase-like glycosyltransferase